MTIIHYMAGQSGKCGTCKFFMRQRHYHSHAVCSCTENKIRNRTRYWNTKACLWHMRDCTEYHEINQDKDDICPTCGKCINEDF